MLRYSGIVAIMDCIVAIIGNTVNIRNDCCLCCCSAII